MPFQILIVDDHPLIRWAIQQLIEQHPEFQVCGTANSVQEGIAALDLHLPDLIILDLLLDDGSGKIIIEEVKKRGLKCKILVSSMCRDPRVISDILRKGVTGFIDKGLPMDKLLEGIQSVLAGQTVISPAIQKLCVDAIRDGVDSHIDQAHGLNDLSRRESEIFEMMGQNLNPQEIADKLGIALKTVHTHRQNIRQKMHLRSMAELNGKAAVYVTNRENDNVQAN
jgi:DNA-binding NarL/FixJ family response regulator